MKPSQKEYIQTNKTKKSKPPIIKTLPFLISFLKMSEEEEEDEVTLEKYKGYHVGDCVSYEVDDLKDVESQGVIFSIVKNNEDEVWFELNLMKRSPPSPLWDVQGPKMYAYRYYDLDELTWVKFEQLICIVHLEFIPGDEKKLNRGVLMDSLDSSIRKQGVLYYKEGPGGAPGASMQLKLSWYHFDKEWLGSLEWRGKRCLAIDDMDLTIGFCSVLKPILFDPFVSPYSYSHRHGQIHWNIRSWKVLLRATQDKTIQWEYELEQLQQPRREDIIKKEELFIGGGGEILKFIFILLKEWMKLDPRETSIYSVMYYLNHHQKIMEAVLRKLSQKVEREAYQEDSTDSDVSDLDEHESFGGDSSLSEIDEERRLSEVSEEEEEEEEDDFSDLDDSSSSCASSSDASTKE